MKEGGGTFDLFTDLYELTMAQADWQSGRTATATFSLYFRSYPPDRAYFVLGGMDDVLDYLETLKFTEESLAYLKSTGIFDDGFVDFLGGLRFTGSVRAMPEGTIFFANEPVVEVTAPVMEAQIVETYLLNQINLQTVLATKASRVLHAARGKALVDFAARRTHGTDAANKLARVCYMVGFAGTSNVLAGKLYGIPVFGTMAHSFIETFERESDAFRAYAASFPDSTTLLVDTYDTVEGVRRAIRVAKGMRAEGNELRAIRLDSGDLAGLAAHSRSLLDEAGFSNVEIFASGGIDEFEIDALMVAGAPIDGFGVGTKLVEYDGRPTLKLSTDKQTLPGPKQVYRRSGSDESFSGDVVATADETPSDDSLEPLLTEVMAGGKRLRPRETLADLRQRFTRQFRSLPDDFKALRAPPMYPVSVSDELERQRRTLTDRIMKRLRFDS